MKQYAPATERNREAILEVLQQVLPQFGTILEVASGTGEHAVFFAPFLQPRRWLPSDANPVSRASIDAWLKEFKIENLSAPIEIDASSSIWAVEDSALLNNSPITAIVNINMIHISPWAACLGLMAGAGRILPPDGILYMYGPYKQGGKHTAPSNEAFDMSLRQQNPQWGVRDLDEVVAVASSQQLSLLKTVEMPANNLSLVFKRGNDII
jgi:hypothetical protein